MAKRVTSGLANGTYLLYPPNFDDKLVISDSSGGGADPEGGPLAKRVTGQGATFGFDLPEEDNMSKPRDTHKEKKKKPQKTAKEKKQEKLEKKKSRYQQFI